MHSNRSLESFLLLPGAYASVSGEVAFAARKHRQRAPTYIKSYIGIVIPLQTGVSTLGVVIAVSEQRVGRAVFDVCRYECG